MPIAVKCSDCGKQYRLKDETAGKSFGCKECGKRITVPDVQLLQDDDFQDEDDSWEVEDEGYQPSSKRQTRPRRQKKKKKSSFSILSVLAGVVLVFITIGVVTGIVTSIKNDGRPERPFNNGLGGFQPEDFQEVADDQWKRINYDKLDISVMMPDNAETRKKRIAINGSVKHRSFSADSIRLTNKFYGCEILCVPASVEIGLDDLKPLIEEVDAALSTWSIVSFVEYFLC